MRNYCCGARSQEREWAVGSRHWSVVSLGGNCDFYSDLTFAHCLLPNAHCLFTTPWSFDVARGFDDFEQELFVLVASWLAALPACGARFRGGVALERGSLHPRRAALA